MDNKELSQNEQHWNANRFSEYMKASLRGKDYLHLYNEFPKTIDPNNILNTLIETQKRSLTDINSRESANIIVLGEDKLSLHSLSIPPLGEKGHVPGELYVQMIQKAKQQNLNIESGVITVHSHPRGNLSDKYNIPWYLGRKIISDLNYYLTLTGNSGPSVGDIYATLAYKLHTPLSFVVEPDSIYLICKARDTIPTLSMNQEYFVKYWYEKLNYEFDSKDTALGEIAKPVKITDYKPSIDIATTICKNHKLVLYKGMLGEELKKLI